jgi:general secretion pathway protein H
MTWRCDAAPAAKAAGFTLIEIIVVLAILGFALAMIARYGAPPTRGLDLRGAAGAVASGLRLARSEAILRNHPVTFDLDLAGHRFRPGSGKAQQLSPALAIELLTIAGERRRGNAGDIRFNPDGSSSGGRITLADGGRKIMIGVDWLTGRVSVADAAR